MNEIKIIMIYAPVGIAGRSAYGEKIFKEYQAKFFKNPILIRMDEIVQNTYTPNDLNIYIKKVQEAIDSNETFLILDYGKLLGEKDTILRNLNFYEKKVHLDFLILSPELNKLIEREEKKYQKKMTDDRKKELIKQLNYAKYPQMEDFLCLNKFESVRIIEVDNSEHYYYLNVDYLF